MSRRTSSAHPPRQRSVAVVTGTRADFGLFRTVLQAIDTRSDLRLQIVVTGTHLLSEFGYTVGDILRDGWTIDARVPMQRGDDSPTDQAEGLARGVAGIARFLVGAGTDLVLVLGDRIEALAGALAAVTTGRFVAHLHGGDVAPGDTDNLLRDGISKLAHLHLTATPQAARRVVGLGENPRQVHTVGAPGLDELLEAAREDYARGSGPALVLHHACGRPPHEERRVMARLLAAVTSCSLPALVIQPNSDRGHSGINGALLDLPPNGSASPTIQVVPSLPRAEYLRRLLEAPVLIGNSSSGIIEAATVGTPCVNVGTRQQGRLRSAEGVLDCGESLADIRRTLAKALTLRPKKPRRTAYGNGQAGPRIARLLAEFPLTDAVRRKCSQAR